MEEGRNGEEEKKEKQCLEACVEVLLSLGYEVVTAAMV